MAYTSGRKPVDAVLRELAVAVHVGVLLHDGTGAVVFCNPAGEAILGTTQDRLHDRGGGTLPWEAVDEDGAPFPAAAFPPLVAVRTGEPVRDVTMGVQRHDGALVWLRLDAEPVAGDGIAVVTTFREVTEQRLLEELLALQSALATLPVGIVIGENPPGRSPRVLAYNEHFRRMVGAPPAEGSHVGAIHYRIFAPDRRTELAPEEWPGPRAARLGRSIRDVELHVLRDDGTWRILEVSAAPVRSGTHARPHGAVVVAIDVTEQRRALGAPG